MTKQADIERRPATSLKVEMVRQGWTNAKLASHIEVDPTQLSRWATGLRPNPENRAKLAATLGKTEQELGW